MYAYPGVYYRKLDQIIDDGFKRIDEAVEKVIAKYPAPETSKEDIENVCSKQVSFDEKRTLGALQYNALYNRLRNLQPMENPYLSAQQGDLKHAGALSGMLGGIF